MRPIADRPVAIPYLIIEITALTVWGCDEPTTITEDTPTLCQDRGDSDADGLTDCEDPDCASFAVCLTADGDADSDGDGDGDDDGDSDSDGDADGDGDDDGDVPVDPRFGPALAGAMSD